MKPPLLPLASALGALGFAAATTSSGADPASVEHGTVFSEEGKFGGWPANGGMWNWGDEVLVLLNAEKSNRREGRVGAFRTRDGGLNWERVGWIGPESEGFAILPSSVRLLLTYYRNHALDKDRAPYRHIAWTLWEVGSAD
jgi:hypothetical protein